MTLDFLPQFWVRTHEGSLIIGCGLFRFLHDFILHVFGKYYLYFNRDVAYSELSEMHFLEGKKKCGFHFIPLWSHLFLGSPDQFNLNNFVY